MPSTTRRVGARVEIDGEKEYKNFGWKQEQIEY